MGKRIQRVIVRAICLGVLVSGTSGFAQKPHKMGTTAANFLEIGYGSAGCAMGDAYVSLANDLSSIYWNPAGLAFMEQSEAQFMVQPWLVDINTSFAAVGLILPNLGTLSLGLFQTGYGEMDVTTLELQEGTGERFTAGDLSIDLSYARKLVQWFAFGVSVKYVSSKIWHSTASAIALDLGVIIHTHFFSTTGERDNGMRIGMSISNYGTKMRYDGIDLLTSIDIIPYESGNYKDVPGQFRMSSWELPLIFRLGASVDPLVAGGHRLTLAADALHTNNADESANLGAQYQLTSPSFGTVSLRAGYKALFMDDSEFGWTFGGGFEMRLMRNASIKIDYAYRSVGLFGKVHAYSVGVCF